MTRDLDEPTRMACPNCGGDEFSWITEQVQFGDVQYFPEHDTYDEVALGNGEIVGMARLNPPGADEDEDLFCTDCDRYLSHDELVPPEGVEY